MKYDFLIKAGADPRKIKMKYKGAKTVYLDKDGSVIATTPLGEIREEKPYTYSRNTGIRIENEYKVKGNFVFFDIAEYNKSEDIIIDPYRVWATTYYGGSSGIEEGNSICTDNSDNLYITGYTTSTDFPTQTKTEAYNDNTLGGIDAFILKFNSSGARLWAAYYGGSCTDYGYSICTDNSNNLYVTGETSSPNFPTQTLTGAYNQAALGGSSDAFILKFNSSGARLWATYYGGSGIDRGYDIFIDDSVYIYITGITETNFPTQTLTGAYNQTTSGGDFDAFILRFNSNGARIWATYYGGNGSETGKSICTDNSDNLYITGFTNSPNFPTQTLVGAYNQTHAFRDDVFILKFNSSDTIIWATYYGGHGYYTGNDRGRSICTDNSGNIYVTGETETFDFPTLFFPGAYNQNASTQPDAFILKFNSSGTRQWATCYGGIGSIERAHSICIDNSGNLYVTGITGGGLPTQTLTEAYNQTTSGGSWDAFILKFNSSDTIIWATYYGGSDYDIGNGICKDNSGALYVTGYTLSTNFPTQTLDGAYNQTTSGGDRDAFILKFNNSGARQWATYYGGGYDCPAPHMLANTNITYQSADLGWIEIGTATSWDTELGLTGFTQTFTPTQSGVTNPYTYTGLTAGTTYDWYVRSDCGGGDYSNCCQSPGTFITETYYYGGGAGNGGGYYFANSVASGCPSNPTYSWVDPVVNGHTEITSWTSGDDDNGYFQVPDIGFNFTFFGNTYRTNDVYIGTNGYVSFGAGYTADTTSASIPSTGDPNNFIAGCAMDLDDGTDGQIFYGGDASQFVVTWVKYYDNGSSSEWITFQIILCSYGSPNNDIIIQYNDAQSTTSTGIDNDALIGVENSAGTDGAEYRNDGSGGPIFGSDLALQFGSDENALPVKLVSFNAIVEKNNVTLNWTTASEINNAGFDVERKSLSSGKDTWTKIGFVEGNGTTNETKNYTFIDRKLKTGKYNYRLVQRDYNNRGVEHFLSDLVTVGVPTKYNISQNYPNPFNPITRIDYSLPFDSKVSLQIFDALGREVVTLVNDYQNAGYYTIDFNASNLASGIYFYRMLAGDFSAIKKMVVIK